MADIACSLNDAGNWQSIFLQAFTAVPASPDPNIFHPIPEKTLLLSTDSPLLAIRIKTPKYPTEVKWTNTVFQAVDIPNAPFEEPYAIAARRRLYCNRVTLLESTLKGRNTT